MTDYTELIAKLRDETNQTWLLRRLEAATAIAALVAERDALRAELEEARRLLTHAGLPAAQEEHNALVAERDLLRATLSTIETYAGSALLPIDAAKGP